MHIHPTLGRYLKDLDNSKAKGGVLSYLALGDTSESFFIRLEDNKGNWHYRYHGLPMDCELEIQRYLTTNYAYGHLRGVTLGQGGGWILYGNDKTEFRWGGKYLPSNLRTALKYGGRQKLIINVSILSKPPQIMAWFVTPH